jgi:hypothetical protein
MGLPSYLESAKAVQDELQLVESALWKKNKKFVAAEADSHVRTANYLVEMRGEFLKDVVTGGMAVAVVDQLEIVEVESKHGQRMTAALGARDLCGEALNTKTAVIEAGQRIDHGHVAKNVGMTLFLGELEAQAFDEDLLVNGVEVEKDDENDQTKNGVVQLKVKEGFRALARERQSKSDDGESKEEHDKDGVAPDPPVALLDLPEFASEIVIASLWRRRDRASLEFSHRVEVRLGNSRFKPS